MVTLVVAVLALVVGLAGIVIAAIALGRSDKATTLATSANGRPLPPADAETPAAPEPASPTTEPSDTATETLEPGVTASPGDISPTAEFAIAYQDQHLRVQTEKCLSGWGAAVDFDEPRVIGGTEGDMVYEQCNPGAVQTGLPLAEVSGQSATPADCLENIRTTPAQSPVAPAEGLTFCFLTSRNDAAARGTTQKLVFVTVDSITEKNDHGILNITLRAWNVPE
ncbi:hypothetical protein [Actinoplanes auranticolor]|uniref:hypothetical protein n=1 Tax=Actinoplanes auranticolor TaxID=47988 RepID=UPI001BB358CC|nr:hypothetical protein [Actinoplanes auranticolor]